MTKQVMQLNVVECYDIPESPNHDTVYRLLPKSPDSEYYWERIDRNIGWITEEEQAMLRTMTVGIAGCGGMGGLIASTLTRLGIGEIRIADCENFDISNINRQFGAQRSNVGKSKVFETARMIRAITDDTTLVVYPQGISEETVDHFLNGCDVVCDEIEFWAVGARILLHQEARKSGISLFCCSTVGFGTRLLLFTPAGYTMEQCLGLTYGEAVELQSKIQAGVADKEEARCVMERVLSGIVPEAPEYCPKDPYYRTVERGLYRLREEGKAPIIATNPPMASGFVSDHVLFYLLRNSDIKRDIVRPPEIPGYLYFDVAHMDARIVRRKEVHHE